METAKKILQDYWGYPDFRPGQMQVIEAAIHKKRSLAIMPTGAGKSICFQVPALMQEGVALVVSPLIALMQDQVQQLKSRGIKAEAIYSGMQYSRLDSILDNCIYGDTKFLYVSPERLQTDLFLSRFRQMYINLIVVDEAHCISQWGHDFRPSYLEIAEITEIHPEAHLLSVTATAPPMVEKDICKYLDIPPENVLTFDMNRENLHFLIVEAEEKEEQLVSLLRKTRGAAVIYCRRRSLCTEIADFLNQRNIPAIAYHAGMQAKKREEHQELFMSGKVRCIAATTAFGMGVDKSDVRYVFHLQLPNGPEEYFQEAGRAGRDKEDAYCVLLHAESDALELKKRVQRQFSPLKTIAEIFEELMHSLNIAYEDGQFQSFDFDLQTFCLQRERKKSQVLNALFFIEKSGILTLSDAVRNTSMLRVTMDRKHLMDYQQRDAVLDKFMKLILRTYEGLFTDYVKIHEEYIAKSMEWTTGELEQYLDKLVEEKVLDYLPRSSNPQITMQIDRPRKKRLNLDGKLYRFLKERTESRMQAMLDFVDSSECRVRKMLQYFGQEHGEDCGKCDICLGSATREPSAEEKKQIKRVLADLLKEQKKVPIQSFIDAFPIIFRKRVLTVVKGLVEEEKLRLDKTHKISLP